MDMCKFKPLAIRVHRRTINLIQSFDKKIELEGNEDKFFMIYCYGSDHEETEMIDQVTYDRTYEAMPELELVNTVNTID